MNNRIVNRIGMMAVGSGVGLVAGLLLAPNAGSSTRETFKKRAQEGWERIRQSTIIPSRPDDNASSSPDPTLASVLDPTTEPIHD